MPKHIKIAISSNNALDFALSQLSERIAQLTNGEGLYEPKTIKGLSVYQISQPQPPTGIVYEPTICLVAQGAKRITLGDEVYAYDPQHFLISSVNLPTIVQLTEASPSKPYRGLALKLNLPVISQLMVDCNLPPPPVQQASRGMAIGRNTEPFIAAFVRLLDVLASPQDIPIIAPMIEREIFYYLLMGEQGARLRQIALMRSQGYQVAQTIEWLKNNYSESLHMDELAERANMSASSFHQHFRTLTAMSPLQYQKWLRLNEARRLMLSENHDAASAAFAVGYESPSQFSREYSRLFGAPPVRDIARLRVG